jgi:hypothetical protein
MAEATSPQGIPIYQAIQQRVSVRRFLHKPLVRETLEQVRAIIDSVRALSEENLFNAPLYHVNPGENLTRTLGAYGNIVNPPYYLAPYIIGHNHPLVDLGYRVEQIVVHLTSIGIGTCFLGTISRQERVRQIIGIPENAVIGALLCFGLATSSGAGQFINRMLHRSTGAQNKLPLQKIFFWGDFSHPSIPPDWLRKHIEAGRLAPSAVNAQPWRLLWRDGWLFLYVLRINSRYGPRSKDYRLYDGGICMANISLSLSVSGISARWELHDETQQNFPSCPDTLQPLARIELSEEISKG